MIDYFKSAKSTLLIVILMLFSGWLFTYQTITENAFTLYTAYIFLNNILIIILIIEHLDDNKIYSLIDSLILALNNILMFAFLYNEYGITNSDKLLIKHDYMISLYFSIITWTTLGYGDFTPTENTRIFASIEALLGYIYTAIIIGLLINYLQRKK